MKQHFFKKITTSFMILCLALNNSSCGLNSEDHLSETLTETTAVGYSEKETLSGTTQSTANSPKEPIASTAISQTNDNIPETMENDMVDTNSWKIVIIEELSAWQYSQNVWIVNQRGDVFNNHYTDTNDCIHMNNNETLDKIDAICNENVAIKTLSNDETNKLDLLINNISEITNYEYSKKRTGSYDSGTKSVYIINNCDSKINQTKICSYGSYIECIDNDDARQFANYLVDLQLLYTGNSVF